MLSGRCGTAGNRLAEPPGRTGPRPDESGCITAADGLTHTAIARGSAAGACKNRTREKRIMRQGLVMALMGTLMLVAGCSGGGGETYTLRGTPTPRSGTNSGNFIVQGKTCKYVTMVGFYAADAPVTSYPCKVLQDDDNSLGDPHAHMTISVTTPKGDQTVKIDGTPAGMTATQAPDLGNNYPFPPAWAVAAPAPNLTLVNN